MPIHLETEPALLVSYYYLEGFQKAREHYAFRDWVMDSGAFTAHTQGVEVDLQAYIDTCLRLLEEDPRLTEIYSLDVIGDHEASLRNCEEMHRQGVAAIPTFHVDEPVEALAEMGRKYEKIALGGMVGFRRKLEFAEQCFARVWPKKIHGFGVGSGKMILALPWDSVDASNWDSGPNRYGRWNRFGAMSVKGFKSLRAEVDHYLRVEFRARQKWKEEMAQVEGDGPVVRLAVATVFPLLVEIYKASIGHEVKR